MKDKEFVEFTKTDCITYLVFYSSDESKDTKGEFYDQITTVHSKSSRHASV